MQKWLIHTYCNRIYLTIYSHLLAMFAAHYNKKESRRVNCVWKDQTHPLRPFCVTAFLLCFYSHLFTTKAGPLIIKPLCRSWHTFFADWEQLHLNNPESFIISPNTLNFVFLRVGITVESMKQLVGLLCLQKLCSSLINPEQTMLRHYFKMC